MSKYLGIMERLCYFIHIVISKFSKKGAFLKTGFNHLSVYKQRKLGMVTQILLRKIKPEMIIFFDSVNIDDYTDDPYTIRVVNHEYRTGFRLLVITENDIPENVSKWEKTEKSIEKYLAPNLACLVLHTISFVNDEISAGNIFFGNMLENGIMLHNTGRFRLRQPVERSSYIHKIKAQDYFDEWFNSANDFLMSFRSNFEKTSYKLAVFELHQAVERFYTCTLLIHTGYRYKTHNIHKLSLMCAFFNKNLYLVFPRSSVVEKELFDILHKAYIDARYKKTYVVTKEQLQRLAVGAYKLQRLTEKVCKEKIAELGMIFLIITQYDNLLSSLFYSGIW